MRLVPDFLRRRRRRHAQSLYEKRLLDRDLRSAEAEKLDRDRMLDRAKRGGYNVPTRL